jgi:dTDP-4-amino-4,6-dideoxygalactose transaminase
MITTLNPAWDRQFRLWRQHSMSASDTARHTSRRVVAEEYTELGFNYRLTDLQAAIGRVQLERLPAMVTARRAIARRYDELLRAVPDLQLPCEPPWARSNWQSYCVRLPAGVDQLRVMQAMLDDNIATRRGVMCAHREPAYRLEPWRTPAADGMLAVSEAISADGLILPLYTDLTDNDQAHVVESLARAVHGAASC